MYGLGFWILLTGFMECQASSTEQISLSNKHLKIAITANRLFLYIRKDGNGKVSYSGPFWDTIEYIKKARNLTLTVVIPHERLIGNCYGSNNCTGIIGMVNRKEVDLALGII